ncbi:MAG TPA: hypothetical protein VHX52_03525 [Steroidobacteraceae bacterium]|nr:hypothetical protein [Steroidobacteraceae bacterium]
MSDSRADLAVNDAVDEAVDGTVGSAMGAGAAAPAASAHIDRNFIASHQIVERYLSGRLPLKGAQDFERFCREHPELLDEIGLSERLNAALRLLEAGARTPPWEERSKRWWEKLLTLPVLAGSICLCVILAVTNLVSAGRLGAQERRADTLTQRLAAQPLEAAATTRSITLLPSRTAPTRQSLATIGGSEAEMADLKVDLSWAKFASYQVTIDRLDQGRVAVLRGLQRDSNGNLRIDLNSSALGPGSYQLSIDGLNWRGEPVAQAWATFTIIH